MPESKKPPKKFSDVATPEVEVGDVVDEQLLIKSFTSTKAGSFEGYLTLIEAEKDGQAIRIRTASDNIKADLESVKNELPLITTVVKKGRAYRLS